MTFFQKNKKKQYTERKNQSANEPLALQWRQQHLPPHSHNHTYTHINKPATFLAMQTCVMAVRVCMHERVCVCVCVSVRWCACGGRIFPWLRVNALYKSVEFAAWNREKTNARNTKWPTKKYRK